MVKIIQASGARKESVARATIKDGKGKIQINGKLLANFSDEMSRLRISEPLVLSGDLIKKVNISVRVNGGGINGQSDAVRLSIARALVEYDKKLKKVFDDYDRLLLVADVRRK